MNFEWAQARVEEFLALLDQNYESWNNGWGTTQSDAEIYEGLSTITRMLMRLGLAPRVLQLTPVAAGGTSRSRKPRRYSSEDCGMPRK
jgi:hypothetical protein